MLCIAYHNLGFEEEFMSNLDGALQAYFKAYKLGEEHMGANSKLTEKFRVSYEEARDV